MTTNQMRARAKAPNLAKSAKLLLVIDGEPLELWPYQDEDEGRTCMGHEHLLKRPGGRWWGVYEEGISMRAILAGDGRRRSFHCERCKLPDCPHVRALKRFGLL